MASDRRRRRRSMFSPGAWMVLIFVGLVAAAVAVAWFAAGLEPLSR